MARSSFWRLAATVSFLAASLQAVGCGSILGIDDGQPIGDASSEFGGEDVGFPESGSGSSGGSSGGADVANDRPSDTSTQDVGDVVSHDAPADGGPCAPGTRGCDGTNVAFCLLDDAGTGQWQDIMACSGSTPLCLNGNCVACSPGTLGCDVLQPQSCDQSGTWQDLGQACPYMCNAGKCGGVCTPGTQQCADSTDSESCSAAGAWTITPCTGSICAGAGVCGVCMPNATKCDDGTHTDTCGPDGNWEGPVVCGSGETCTSGACTGGACSTGATRCQGNSVQTCTGGQWGSTMACSSQTCVNGSCVGVCAPGQTKCDGSTNSVQTCDSSGNWVDSTNCTTTSQTCVQNSSGATCTGACAPGQTDCSNNWLQTCSTQGQWANATNCTTDAPPQTCTCGSTCSCSGVCAPGQAECDPGGNNYLQYCDGTGNWQDSFLCQYVCVAGQTACSGVCTPGAIQCNQGMPQQCNGAGQWMSCNSPACLTGVAPMPAVAQGAARRARRPAGAAPVSAVWTMAPAVACVETPAVQLAAEQGRSAWDLTSAATG